MTALARILALFALLGTLASPPAARAGEAATEPAAAREPRHAIEFSPLSPMIHIWAAQVASPAREHEELILGLAYMNIRYDHGRSHAPTALLGYRRYLWRGAHVEYQLMPSYNWFYETTERRYYRGAELWNEVRAGYTFDVRAAGHPAFINVQGLAGFALVGGNKPESFERDIEGEELFLSPMLFFGWRF